MANAGSRYNTLRSQRDEYVRRGREVSRLTIPYVFTGDETDLHNTTKGEMPDPNQSTGARGVRNLSSRLAMVLFPPNVPFFNYTVSQELLDQLPPEVDEGEVKLAMNVLTKSVQSEISRSNFRVEITEMLMSLIVDGNPLIRIDDELKVSVFRLNNFVVQRDQSDNLLEFVLKETLSRESLGDREDIIALLEDEDPGSDKSKVNIYTHVKRQEDGSFREYQEVCNKEIPGTEFKYPENKMPWILPRVAKITGEHYGRSYGEEFLGDLRAYEGLSKALNEMAAASARVIFMVQPSAGLNLRNLKNVPNGGFVAGDANQINPLQARMQGDFQVVQAQAQSIDVRLQQAFLLASSIQRNAERVTAEEIRMMADELDNSLGGLFTILAAELQMRIVEIFQSILKRKGTIKVPDEVQPQLVTGIDALGRGQDLGRLNQFVGNLLQLGQALPDLAQRVNTDELVDRLAAAHGIDPNGLIKTQEEIQAEMEQAQMQQALQGQMGQAMGQIAVDSQDPAKQAKMIEAEAKAAEGQQ